MRRLFAAGAVVVAVVAVSVGARADFRTGNELYADCTSSDGTDRIFCQGYIAAIVDAARLRAPGGGLGPGVAGGYRMCITASAGGTLQQMVDIVVKFLTAHPEERHLPASPLAAGALSVAFPCQ
jgi:hypothetical protein